MLIAPHPTSTSPTLTWRQNVRAWSPPGAPPARHELTAATGMLTSSADQPSSAGGWYTRPTPNHSADRTTRAADTASGPVTRSGATTPPVGRLVGGEALMAALSAPAGPP
ncbi:hypothetical protein GCM10027610_062460 [Dactylosporangium cerinum]